MLNIGKDNERKAKCYFTHTVLPQYIDDKQPPTKRKPFSQIHAQPFYHTLDLIVPEAKADKIQNAIEAAASPLLYCKVHLKLLDILTGDFFNSYIKTGNILLLSSGSPSQTSPHITLSSGLLQISLSKPLYERLGLPGVPILDPSPTSGCGGGPKQHTKPRFLVTLNLRLPSMVKGKRGFERLIWAAENVLTETLTWVFVDLRGEEEEEQGGFEAKGKGVVKGATIEGFAPVVRRVGVERVEMKEVLVPGFEKMMGGATTATTTTTEAVGEERKEEVVDLLEWIALVCLGAGQVRRGAGLDSFLSRYEVPRIGSGGEGEGGEGEERQKEEVEPRAVDLVRLRWRGFMSAEWVAKVFTAALKAAGNGGGEDGGEEWFAMKVCGFEDRSLVVLKQGGTALTWQCE